MSAAVEIQREIGRLQGRMEMTDHLEALSLRLVEIESERRIETWHARTADVQAKLDAHERREVAREQARQEILYRGALEGIGISDRIARRLAEGAPVLAGNDLVFPTTELLSLREAVDRLRVVEPSLFEEAVVIEPHDDEIQAYRRDLWGDIPE